MQKNIQRLLGWILAIAIIAAQVLVSVPVKADAVEINIIQGKLCFPGGGRGHITNLLQQSFAGSGDRYGYVFKFSGDIEADISAAASLLQIHGSVNGGIFDFSNAVDGIPVLFKFFGFIGSDPSEVRLIISKYTGHQFNIGAIFVC